MFSIKYTEIKNIIPYVIIGIVILGMFMIGSTMGEKKQSKSHKKEESSEPKNTKTNKE
jgi:biopolymer transport protein ExbD